MVDAAGVRRRAKRICCGSQECHKEFLAPLKSTSKFCSKECYRLASRKRETVFCSWCGNHFEKTTSKKRYSRSGLFFCKRSCKDSAQKLGGISEIMPDHYGTAKSKISYRRM